MTSRDQDTSNPKGHRVPAPLGKLILTTVAAMASFAFVAVHPLMATEVTEKATYQHSGAAEKPKVAQWGGVEKPKVPNWGSNEKSKVPHWGSTPAPIKPNEKRPTATLDKYGGYKNVRGQALGYFSLQEVKPGRPSLVTPAGNAFTPVAINKVWSWPFDDASFEEKFGSRHKWAVSTAEFLSSLNFSMYGNNSDLDALLHFGVLRTPYSVAANFTAWDQQERRENSECFDPWTAEFALKVDIESRRIDYKYGDDPYLTMIFPFNEMHWTLQGSNGLQDPAAYHWRCLVGAEGNTPAKDAWVETNRERYDGSIDAFNEVYESDPPLTAFEELNERGLTIYDRFEEVDESEEEDAKKAFVDVTDYNARIAGQSQKVAYETLKSYMPNVLVTSERLVQAQYHPLYFEKTKAYYDILAFNHYGDPPRWETLDYYHDQSGKPLMITEYGFLEEPCNVHHDGGTYPGVPDQATRGTEFMRYRNEVLKYPYLVGLSWEAYVDLPTTANPCGWTNFGVFNIYGEPYDEMIAAGTEVWTDPNVERWAPPED